MKPVYILGDVHGEFFGLRRVIEAKDICDCHLICVGDLGVGFVHRINQAHHLNKLAEFFESRDISFTGIRGNHDDPAYFDGSWMHPHFKLVADYTYMNINGEQFLFVGGGISVDRTGNRRIQGKTYWKDEALVVRPELIDRACDVLVTHPIPTWIGPVSKESIKFWLDRDSGLEQLIDQERQDVTTLVELCQPKNAYFGHFHISDSAYHNGCLGRIVNILEIYEHRTNH